ncbi:MAG: lysostaphin resistance A-like protein [Endozoicomonas sp.]
MIHLSVQLIVPVTLMLAMVSCWCLPRYLTGLFAGLSLGFGLAYGVIQVPALPFIALLLAAAWWLSKVQPAFLKSLLPALLFFAVSVAFMLHWVPGFHNPLIWEQQAVKPLSIPYTLYINSDKPWIALAVLLFLSGYGHLMEPKKPLHVSLLQTREQWHCAFLKSLLPIGLMLVLVFPIAMASGFVRWQPGWPELTAWFLVNNLLLTSLTEEAFFRGFFQGMLSRYLPGNGVGVVVAIMVPALIHGIGHYPGGALYVTLVILCSAFYGWVYHRTGSLEMAVLSHWLLNASHFLLFSYPGIQY